MDSSQIAQLLTAAVAVIMFGLGLSLRLADFARVLRFPRAVVVGLFVQTIVLVGVAYLITRLFALPPVLAVGMMLLASSPGGAMANIFSHFARGDVALNITLTALNCVLALVWMPLVMNWSLEHFLGASQYIPPPTRKIVEVGVVIIAPVVAGMCVRLLAPLLAERAARPVRALSVLVLVAVLVPSVISASDASTSRRSDSPAWRSTWCRSRWVTWRRGWPGCPWHRPRRSRSRSACTMRPSRSTSPPPSLRASPPRCPRPSTASCRC
jgi:BASS family bile acid:Na+ symporter